MKFIKKAAAAIVAASLAFSLCSCSDLSWAAKIDDDTTIPIGMYIYSMASAYRTAVSNYQLNSYTELSEQTIEVSGSDKSAVEYLDNEAKKTIKSYVGAILLAKDMNIEFTDEDLKTAASYAENYYETDKATFEKVGVAKSSVEEYYKSTSLKSKLFEAKYGEKGTEAVADKDLKTYFKENYASINFIQQYFYNEDGTAMSEDQKDALKKEYKSIQSKAEKGKIKFTDVCKEYAKNATNYKGGYTDSLSRFDTESEDGQKILSLQTGKFTLLVTDSAIALIQKATLDKDGSKFKENRSNLLYEYKYDDFVSELIDLGENAKNVKYNESAFEKFSSATRDFSELSISNSNSNY
ncbi:MAG: hypothetical protein ACI4IJ_05850 [Acutalibacteraceae bacterium]